MVERWFFYQDVAGLWKWARLDVVGTILAHSGSSFATREHCTDDARLNGYADQGQREIGCGRAGAWPPDLVELSSELPRR